MITRENYTERIKAIDFRKVDKKIKAAKAYFDKITKKGSDWTEVDSNPANIEMVDLYFKSLSRLLVDNEPQSIQKVHRESQLVRKVMPLHQQRTLKNAHIETVISLEKQLSEIPELYFNDGKPKADVIVHAHYFHAASDWFITEMNLKEDRFYGYTILNGDSQMSEYGYMSISEFRNSKKIELDFHWSKKSLAEALHDADSDYFPKPGKKSPPKKTKSSNSTKKAKTPSKPIQKKNSPTTKTRRSNSLVKPEKVETFSLEFRFLRRYLNLDQNAKTKRQIRLFLNALQRAMIEKKIRKTSKYATEILRLQKDLIALLNSFKHNDIMRVSISKRKRNQISKILGREQEIPSVRYIREYISLQGRPIPTQKAKALHNKIARKVNSGIISFRDKYSTQIKVILKNLRELVDDNPVGGELVVLPKALNGVDCLPTSESPNKKSIRIPDDVVVNSMDLVKMKFDKLGFKNKWFELIGNPSGHFKAMIFGRPKFGKSILAIDFAAYLARNHGTVLYVAKEEGVDEELKKKLQRVAHPDLDTVGDLPKDLTKWDFIFFDSVNKLRLTPMELEELGEKYPEKSFISIFQTTKDGQFRGSQEFMHDMDIVIEVPEKGKAIQTGRYNQGGELNIFSGKAS